MNHPIIYLFNAIIYSYWDLSKTMSVKGPTGDHRWPSLRQSICRTANRRINVTQCVNMKNEFIYYYTFGQEVKRYTKYGLNIGVLAFQQFFDFYSLTCVPVCFYMGPNKWGQLWWKWASEISSAILQFVGYFYSLTRRMSAIFLLSLITYSNGGLWY